MNEIETFTGLKINPFELKPEDIVLKDIAVSLGRINRFNGHTHFPYSVAEHSYHTAVRVRDMCMDRGLDPEEPTRLALLHDASEYLIGDMPYPIKTHPLMEGYRIAEAHIEKVVLVRFNLCADSWTLVKEADTIERDIDCAYRRYHGPWLGPEAASELWFNSALQLGLS